MFWQCQNIVGVVSFKNHVLTFSISQFLIGLWLTEAPKRILVPMSYIVFWDTWISYGDIIRISYGDIIWWYDMEMFDFWWILKHKFHGLVGPPAAIFEKNNNLQNQEENFWFSRMALNHVLTVPEYSRRRELSESCLNIFYLPIFDRFTAHRSLKKNFAPNVRSCFFGIHFSFFLRKKAWGSCFR